MNHPSTLHLTLHEGNEGFAKIPKHPSHPSRVYRREGLKGGIGGLNEEFVQSFAKSLAKGECAMKRTLAFNDRGCRVGETHHRAKLTDSDIDQILELRELGLSYRQIAEKFDDIPGGISKSTVRDIIKCRIRAQTPTNFKVRIAD